MQKVTCNIIRIDNKIVLLIRKNEESDTKYLTRKYINIFSTDSSCKVQTVQTVRKNN